MKLIIDASVVVKWFVREAGHEDALAILRRGDECFAPDLVVLEVAGALDKKIKAGTLTSEHAVEAIWSLQEHLSVLPSTPQIVAALELASELNHPLADCIYMACAIDIGATVVTADDGFVRKARNRGYGTLIRQLGHEALDHSPPQGLSSVELAHISTLAINVGKVFAFAQSKTEKRLGRLNIVDTRLLKPAFDSPAYLKLVRELDSLASEKRHELIALCWLGRGFDGENWDDLVAHARLNEPGDRSDTPYIISKLHYLHAGLARLRTLSESAQNR
ncbi:MAG: PIN domain-containing protein [Methylobacterium sp.]|nr:PIN domain-containing protein [Methylobacterium sp.]